MRLSIIILTHNRPILFQRALSSILRHLPEYPIEILVNNDSDDIKPVLDSRVNIRYFQFKSHDISILYKKMFDEASGDFVYYLEDDDYIMSNFFREISFDVDVNYFEYISQPEVQEHGLIGACGIIAANRKYKHITSLREFIDVFDEIEFQLGQILFRKACVSEFPTGNNIRNDYHLLASLATESTVMKYIPTQTWIQTTDGQDNISVPELNRDERFYEI